jgi:mannose-1-phosphate guanylyltransferase
MKALLLAAGFGTRLRPLTNHTPKCLVEIGGKPLLSYWIDPLLEAGVSEFLINTHYLNEQFQDYVENSPYKGHIRLFHEEKLLGTAGTLMNLKSFCRDDDTLVAHADNLCLCNWDDFFMEHQRRSPECLMTMMLFQTDTPRSCGIVKLDNKKVVEFHEKVDNPPSNLANAAVYCTSPALFDYLENGENQLNDISLDIIPQLLNKIHTWKNDGYLRDIGTLESLERARRDIQEIGGISVKTNLRKKN